MSITTAQIRGARGLLNWSQSDLSERTGISGTSIGSIENGVSIPRESTISKIKKTLEDAGVEFTPNQGVRLRSGDVKILKGRSDFWQFYEDVFETLKNTPSEVLVCNADERKFEKWLSDENIGTHISRIEILKEKGVKYRILLREGDTYFLHNSGYSEYRWIPSTQFSTAPFYVYGQKLAIMLFDEEPTIIILDYPAVAEAYKKQFDSLWAMAHQAEPGLTEKTAKKN